MGFARGSGGELLRQLEESLPGPVRIQVRQGSVGVGASTDGAQVVIVVERVVNDLDSLIGIGMFGYVALRRIADRRHKRPTITDLGTHAALAAAAPGVPDLVRGMEQKDTVQLEGDTGAGHDARNVYQTTFRGLDHLVLIYTAGNGFVIGHTSVPRALDLTDHTERSPDEVRRLFRDWNA